MESGKCMREREKCERARVPIARAVVHSYYSRLSVCSRSLAPRISILSLLFYYCVHHHHTIAISATVIASRTVVA